MAKRESEVQEISQEDVGTVDAAPRAPKVINLVTMADGSSKNFGKSGKLLSTEEITEAGFSVTFHIVNGEQLTYTSTAVADELTKQQAAFGVASKVKGSCAGVETDELSKVIEAKIKEITEGNFVGRATGEVTQTLSKIQTAYGRVNGIDVATTEGVAKVNAIFAAMSKEDKSALYKVAKIQLALAQIDLEAAEAAVALEDQAKS